MKRKPSATFLRIQDRWERTRRNPEYYSLSEKAHFNEDGFIDYVKTKEAGIEPEVCVNLAEKFGLREMIDPSKEFYELLGYRECPKEVPDSDESRIEFRVNHILLPFDTIVPTPDEDVTASPDGRYVSLDVDISMTNEEIMQEVIATVEGLRKLLNVKPSKYGNTFIKRFSYYKIWDDRKSRTPFRDIALKHKLDREEPIQKAVDRVKKQFYKACELIMGERYDTEKWRKLLYPDGILPQSPDGRLPQPHFITKKGTIDYGIENDLSSDPEVAVLWKDIRRKCENCKRDSECRNACLTGDLSSWDACPDIYSFLTE